MLPNPLHMSHFLRTATTFFFAIAFTGTAAAQMFSYGGYESRATQSISVTTHLIDFKYDGSSEFDTRLDWNGTAYGVSFNRKNFALSIVFGSANADSSDFDESLRLVDATISGWADLIRSRGSSIQVGLPLAIHSNFRTVDGNFTNDFDESFNYTVLGLGSGITLEAEPSGSVEIQARALPIIAMAFRSFEGFAGSSFIVDSDVGVHFMHLFGRYGLSLGYGFRWQKWNTKDVVGFTNVEQDLFDYKSNQHMLRLGLNW